MPQNPDSIRPWNLCYCCLVAKLCPALLGPIDCSPPGSSIHGISQARILEWVAISFSRGTSQSRDQAHITCVSSTGRWVFYHWATYEALGIYTCQKRKDPGDVMEYMKKILFQNRNLKEEEREAGIQHWACLPITWNIWRISFSRTEISGKKKGWRIQLSMFLFPLGKEKDRSTWLWEVWGYCRAKHPSLKRKPAND